MKNVILSTGSFILASVGYRGSFNIELARPEYRNYLPVIQIPDYDAGVISIPNGYDDEAKAIKYRAIPVLNLYCVSGAGMSGDTSGTGTLADPWRSVTQAIAKIKEFKACLNGKSIPANCICLRLNCSGVIDYRVEIKDLSEVIIDGLEIELADQLLTDSVIYLENFTGLFLGLKISGTYYVRVYNYSGGLGDVPELVRGIDVKIGIYNADINVTTKAEAYKTNGDFALSLRAAGFNFYKSRYLSSSLRFYKTAVRFRDTNIYSKMKVVFNAYPNWGGFDKFGLYECVFDEVGDMVIEAYQCDIRECVMNYSDNTHLSGDYSYSSFPMDVIQFSGDGVLSIDGLRINVQVNITSSTVLYDRWISVTMRPLSIYVRTSLLRNVHIDVKVSANEDTPKIAGGIDCDGIITSSRSSEIKNCTVKAVGSGNVRIIRISGIMLSQPDESCTVILENNEIDAEASSTHTYRNAFAGAKGISCSMKRDYQTIGVIDSCTCAAHASIASSGDYCSTAEACGIHISRYSDDQSLPSIINCTVSAPVCANSGGCSDYERCEADFSCIN